MIAISRRYNLEQANYENVKPGDFYITDMITTLLPTEVTEVDDNGFIYEIKDIPLYQKFSDMKGFIIQKVKNKFLILTNETPFIKSSNQCLERFLDELNS